MTHATARHATLAEINITPLIDVMLVLTVIFLMAATVVSSVNLDIGRSEFPDPERTLQQLVVQADGSVQWDGVRIPADAVAAQMQYSARMQPRTTLEISAASDARYEPVALVMAQAKQAGLHNLSVAIESR